MLGMEAELLSVTLLLLPVLPGPAKIEVSEWT
jgi:hypothetical protein